MTNKDIEKVLNSVISWQGVSEDSINELVFNSENVERVLEAHPWITEHLLQVIKAQEIEIG